MSERKVFVQVGATRDGMDLYLDAARRRGMTAVLVETPDYLRWRAVLGRRDFDAYLPVQQPAEVSDLVSALRMLDRTPHLVLAGFERYVMSSYQAAQALGALPEGHSQWFSTPYKRAQRAIMAAVAGGPVGQPRHAFAETLDDLEAAAAGLTFPVVVKPDNGGGGLGIVMVAAIKDLRYARNTLSGLTNYDGGPFNGWIVEEFVDGTEISVQAIARDGKIEILTMCEKLTTTEKDGPLASFREAGHIAHPGTEVDPEIYRFAEACTSAVGYRHGPFHVDMIRSGGTLQLLEIGFRLSGMRVADLVGRTIGRDWGDDAFGANLGEHPVPTPPAPACYTGHVTLRRPDEVTAAEAVVATGEVQMEIQRFQPPTLPPDWAVGVPRSLQSDVYRHAGALARVVVSAGDPGRVAQALERCLAGQPEPARVNH